MGELYNPFPKLPKNIRQIGETEQVVRFYMEDYVNTYLKRLYPTGKQTMRVGLLLGSVEHYDGTPYIFIDGALEMEDIETDGEKIVFSESSWKKAYKCMEESFPKRTIQGWFLCGGPGSQLSPLNYWKQHGQYFAGKNQLMYLNHGLEGEEAIYITSEDGFYRLKGHCIYYERNQMMQDYMITRKDVRRVESGAHETVIKDFRSRMSAKKEQVTLQSRATSAMGMLCGVLSIAVLAGGVVLVNNYTKMQKMESVLASVLPAGASGWEEYQNEKAEDLDFIIEEISGNVYPTEGVGETGESFVAETMSNDVSIDSSLSAGDKQNAEGNQSSSASQSSNGGQRSNVDQSSSAGQNSSTGQNTGTSGQSSIETETTAAAETESLSESQSLVGMGKETGQGDATLNEYPKIDYAAAAANGYKIYEVGAGETLYGICWKQYDNLNHLAEICRLNNLADVDKILAGQKLILP